MTRNIFALFYNAIVSFYNFLSSFWSDWSWLFAMLPPINYVVNELLFLLYYEINNLYHFFAWWDNVRANPTFLSDLYHVVDYIWGGFFDYVLKRGDPGDYRRIIYWPANIIYSILPGISNVLIQLDNWYRLVITALNNLLNWEIVKAAILTWIPKIETLRDWFDDWWGAIRTKIVDWWGLSDNPIRLFITTVTDGLSSLLTAWNNFWTDTWPTWTKSLDTLKTAWDTFWTDIYPTLVDVKWAWEWWRDRLSEVSTLIDSKLKAYLPFYDTLVEIWGDIVLFFTNPFEFLLARFVDWFLGPEER